MPMSSAESSAKAPINRFFEWFGKLGERQKIGGRRIEGETSGTSGGTYPPDRCSGRWCGSAIREILIDEQHHQIGSGDCSRRERLGYGERQIGTMRNSYLGIRHKRIMIPAWLPMMALAANEGGSNS